MRAASVFLFVAACTPDIGSGSYFCGPDSACPEGQACNGPDNRCVVAGAAEPFACMPEENTEPDDNAANAYEFMNVGCGGVPVPFDNCMLEGDREDWIKVAVPAGCTNGTLSARIDYPIAFERLAVEIWDIATNMQYAEDLECSGTGDPAEERRCVRVPVKAATTYGVRVRPAGDGNCDGNCSYNRYTVRVQIEASL